MSAETPRTPREELEIQITALLMGQLEPEEAQALEAQIAADAGLAALHARLRRAAELLREATALPEQPPTPAPLQLSAERRERLLAHFKTPAPSSAEPAPITPFVHPRAKRARRDWSWLTPLSLAASLVAFLGGSIVLNSVWQRKEHAAMDRSGMADAESVHEVASNEATFENASPSFFQRLRRVWRVEPPKSTAALSNDKDWAYRQPIGGDLNGKEISRPAEPMAPLASPAGPAPAGRIAAATSARDLEMYRQGAKTSGDLASAGETISTNGGTLITNGTMTAGASTTGTGMVAHTSRAGGGTEGIYLPQTPQTQTEFETRNTGATLEVEPTNASDATIAYLKRGSSLNNTSGPVDGLGIAGSGGITKAGAGTLTQNNEEYFFALDGPNNALGGKPGSGTGSGTGNGVAHGLTGKGGGGGAGGGEDRFARGDLYLPPTEKFEKEAETRSNGRADGEANQLSSSRKGIPVLGDIPVLGRLFQDSGVAGSDHREMDERGIAADPAKPARDANAFSDYAISAPDSTAEKFALGKDTEKDAAKNSKDQPELALKGTNTYSGATVISGGTLALDDSDSMDASRKIPGEVYRRFENQVGVPGLEGFDNRTNFSIDETFANPNGFEDIGAVTALPGQATPPPSSPKDSLAKNAPLAVPGGAPMADGKSLSDNADFFNKTSPSADQGGPARDNSEKVKQLQIEAKGYYDTGRYDLAFKRAEQMLNIDPYNKQARAMEEQINRAKSDSYITGYNEARSRAVAAVDKAWANPVRRFDIDPNDAQPEDAAGQVPAATERPPTAQYPLASGNRSGSTAIKSNAIDALLFGNSSNLAEARKDLQQAPRPGETSRPSNGRGEKADALYDQKMEEPAVQFEAEAAENITVSSALTALHDELRQAADEKKSGDNAQAVKSKVAIGDGADRTKQLQKTMDQLRSLGQLPEGENVFFGGGTAGKSTNPPVVKQQEIIKRMDKLEARSEEVSELRDGYLDMDGDKETSSEETLKHRKQPDLLEQIEGPRNTVDNAEAQNMRRELMESLDDDRLSLEKRRDGKKLDEKAQQQMQPAQKQATEQISLQQQAVKEAVEVAKLREESDRDTPAAPLPAPTPQPEVTTSSNAFSTFSLNVSDVAFKLSAASLEQGRMPELGTLRSEEFLNAFDYRDPEPSPGLPLAFVTERARYPFAQNRDLLRFSVKTAAVGRQAGKPLNLVLLIDNSGSMERADRVRTLREAMRVLSAQLKPQDKLSVVTFARTPRLWADGVAGDKAGEVTARVSEITPQGGTNLDAALELGYQTAVRHYQPGSINRVVVLTDGAANLGDVNPDDLKKKVEKRRQQGIALDCFGIGWEGLNDDLLEQLSRNGDGRYGFINTPEEAATQFAAQLAGALRVAASDVKVQVEFNPKRVTAYRQVGYAKHQLKKEDFRNNAVDAAEIGAAESGNALYVVDVNPRGEGDLGTVRVRYKVPGTNEYKEQEWPVPYTANVPALDQAGCAMRLAGTSAAFAEWLASSPYATEVTPDRLLKLMNGVSANYGADPRPQKLEWMIRQAKSISGK